MKNRKFIVPLLIVVLLSLFLFPASAEGTLNSLEEFMDYTGGVIIFGNLNDNSEIEVGSQFTDPNTLVIDGLSGNGADVIRIELNSYGQYPFYCDEIVSFNCDHLVFRPVTDYNETPSSENCSIRVYGNFVNGSNHFQRLLYQSSDVAVGDWHDEAGYMVTSISFPLTFNYTPDFAFDSFDGFVIILEFPPIDTIDWSPSEDELVPFTLSADSFSVEFTKVPEESLLVGLFGGITSFVSGSVSWMVAFADIVSRNFMLLLFVVLVPACGIGIGLLKRMFSTN